MSRPSKRNRHKLPAEQQAAAERDFTDDATVRHLTAAFPGRSFPPETVAEVTQALNNWRWLAGIEKGHIEAKRRQRRLADALAALDEVLPAIRTELAEALTMTKEASSETPAGVKEINARRMFADGMVAIDALKAAATLARSSPILFHPEMHIRGIDHWEAYAKPVEDLLIEKLSLNGAPHPSKEGVYRFLSSIAPGLTGEVTSFESVKTHLKRGRRVNRAKLPV